MIFVDYYENHHEFWQEKCDLFLKAVLSVSYQAITKKMPLHTEVCKDTLGNFILKLHIRHFIKQHVRWKHPLWSPVELTAILLQ